MGAGACDDSSDQPAEIGLVYLVKHTRYNGQTNRAALDNAARQRCKRKTTKESRRR